MLVSVTAMDENILEVRDVTNPKYSFVDRLEAMGVFLMEPAFISKCDPILSRRYSSLPRYFTFTMLVF